MLASPPAKHCTAQVEGYLETAFQVDPRASVCLAAEACQLTFSGIFTAKDSTLWVVGTIARALPSVHAFQNSTWLAHYAADGTQLGAREVPGTSVGLGGGFAVDARGVAWLAHIEQGPEAVLQLDRYDGSLTPLPALKDVPRYWGGQLVALDDRVVLAGTKEKALASERSWTSFKLDGTRVASLDETVPQSFIVLARAGTEIGVLADNQLDGTLSAAWLELHDRDGALRWRRPLAYGSGAEFPRLGSDRAGNLTLAESLIDAAKFGINPELLVCTDGICSNYDWWIRVERVSAAGEPNWMWELNANANVGMAALEDGRVLVVSSDTNTVAGNQAQNLDEVKGSLIEIAADGKSCRKLGYRGIVDLDYIEPAPDGSIYFASPWGFGRWKPATF